MNKIIKKEKNNFSNIVYFFSRIFPIPNHSDIVERQRTFVFLYGSFGFLGGICLYLLIDLLPHRDLIIAVHLAQAGLILTLLFLFNRKEIRVRTALLLLIISIQLSISLDMCYIAYAPGDGVAGQEVFGYFVQLCILIPLSAVVYWRPLPYILTSMTLIVYALCVWITKDSYLEMMMPPMFLSIFVLMLIGDKLVQVVNSLDLKEKHTSSKQQKVLEFLKMDEEELFRLIKLVRRDNLSDKQKGELIELLDEQMKTSVLEAATDVVEKKKQHLAALDARNLGLTPYEKEVCLMILRGLSTADIARKLKKTSTAITTIRATIRGKLGLVKEDNLFEALRRLVAER